MSGASEPLSQILLGISHLVSTAGDRREILEALAATTVDHLGADAAVVLEVTGEGGAQVVATRNLGRQLEGRGSAAAHGAVPESLRPLRFEPEAIDEVGERLLDATRGRFVQAKTLPLISDGDLYGALVILLERPGAVDRQKLELAEGLVDLAAIAMGKAAQYTKLEKAFAELQRSRDALVHAEKLRALGQMAAGVSHDLKNIFQPLLSQIYLLRRAAPGSDPIVQLADRMERTVTRGIDTVERLRTLSRQAPSAPAPGNLNDLIDEALELARARMAPGLELRREIGHPPPVLVEASEIVTSLLNLFVNAIEAMPGGGVVTVRSGADARGAWIEVADTGPGMPPEVAQKAFEPFFTTKGDHGTGLGLALAYATVQRQGGQLTLDTAPGQGARFRMWFPCQPGIARPAGG